MNNFTKTIQMLNDYPYEIIIFRKKMMSPSEIIAMLQKINNNKILVNTNDLHTNVSDAITKTSGWKWNPNAPKKIDYDKVMEAMLND